MKVRFSNNLVRFLIPAIAAFVAIAVILLGIRIWDHNRQTLPTDGDGYLSDDSEKAIVYLDGKPYTLKDKVQTVLFLGIDQYESVESYANKKQADLLMLMVVDHEARQFSVLPINRDTMAAFDMISVTGESAGEITAQIALAHAYGSGEKDSIRNVIHAVSDLLYGTKIDRYFSVQMDAVPIINDAVGGVELELLDDFTMLDPSYTAGTVVTLQGEQALSYVQERGALQDSSNESRMKRQQQYLTSWEAAFLDAREDNEMLIASMMADIADYMLSDFTVDQMNDLADDLETYSSNGFLSIEGESVVEDGHTAFYVNEEALRKQVISLFYESAQTK